jgi:hypothetical protein
MPCTQARTRNVLQRFYSYTCSRPKFPVADCSFYCQNISRTQLLLLPIILVCYSPFTLYSGNLNDGQASLESGVGILTKEYTLLSRALVEFVRQTRNDSFNAKGSLLQFVEVSNFSHSGMHSGGYRRQLLLI